MKKRKKAQEGVTLKRAIGDTTSLKPSVKSTSSSLDSAIARKKAQGTKEWTPAERAKWQKSGPLQGPPPGFKMKRKK